MATARVPMLDESGRLPDAYAPTSKQDVSTLEADVASKVGSGGALDVALSSTYAPASVAQDVYQALPVTSVQAGSDGQRGFQLTKAGVMLWPTGSTFEAGAVESPCVFWDAASQQYGMVYTGYDAAVEHASVCLAWAVSPLGPWTKTSSPLLSGTGVEGDPDGAGCTGPLMIIEDGVYHLFYIGLTQPGYESGTKRLLLATASSIGGPWTRRGVQIAPAGTGWRGQAVYHPSIVKRSGIYYCFFNAAADGAVESIGYATSASLLGPWTVDDVHSPLVQHGDTGTWESTFVGDPSIYRVGDTWYMAYYGFDGTHGRDGVAYTTDALFPLGWTKHSANPILDIGGSEEKDSLHAHKPFILVTPERHYHYYSSVSGSNVRGISLAVAPGVRTRQIFALDEQIRSTASTDFIPAPVTDILYEQTGKLGLRVRMHVRGNPNGSTLTAWLWPVIGAAVTLSGGEWTNGVTPWISLDGNDGYLYGYVQFRSGSSSVEVSLVKAWLEFDFYPTT